MDKSIGALYKKKVQAERAYAALRQAGFSDEAISIWVHRDNAPPRDERRVSIVEIGISAAVGAVVVGIVAAVLGVLISLGGVDIPGFRPDFARGSSAESVAFGLFVVQGAITGAILGAAFRLFTSRRGARITPTGIKRGGVLLVVKADDTREQKARGIMQEHDAQDLENLSEKWDSSVWQDFREVQPSAGG